MNAIPKGVWPTMLTPFTDSNEIDYIALENMIEWYISHNVDGLFATCQSSEIFFLSREERKDIARFVVEKTAGRLPVIASGHISDSMDDQIAELRETAASGVAAVVLVSNRLAKENESDEVWKKNAEIIISAIPNISFGLYECPYPYKRLLSPELLRWCAQTGRFAFLKDTCCDIEQLKLKLKAVEGTDLKIFNANSATLLESLKIGASGFSGVMANFHPELYVWLMRNWSNNPQESQVIQNYLGLASLIERQLYPVNAKYHMQLEGLPISLKCRSKEASGFTSFEAMEVKQLRELCTTVKTMILNIKTVCCE